MLINKLISLVIALLLYHVNAEAPVEGLMETSGFHCMHKNSMQLNRKLHGPPQTTHPPYELSVFDRQGRTVEFYELGQVYTVRVIGYIHFRGLMLQSRLCTPDGHIIGSLRGGEFLIDNRWLDFGVQYHNCTDSPMSRDALTHLNDSKKFLLDVQWKTERDIGAVQFCLTAASENDLYWEFWRPIEAFLRPANMVDVHLDPSLFLYKNNTEHVVAQANPKILYLKGKGRKQSSQKISERSLKSGEETGTTTADFEGMTPTSAEMTVSEDEKPMLVSNFELNEDSTKATNTHKDFPDPEQMLVTQTNDFSVPFEARDDVFADSAENPFQFDDRITDPSTQLETVVPRQTTFDEFTTLLPEESNHSLAELIQKEEESLPHRKFIVERVLHVLSPNETMSPRLRTGDVRFLNAQNHFVQRDFIEENDADTVEEKPCKEANFCLNGGQCFRNSEGKPICLCEAGFIGNNCETKDACLNHACANNATCESVSEKIYKCNCRKGFAGVYCDFVCDLQCGNGECVEKQGNLMCKCNPGWKGSKCDINIDECLTANCANGATCVDKINDYKCLCTEGWMGKNCDRPCRDIFNTCRIWKREGQCENQLTTFFDINCAASCEICTVNNETIEEVSHLPLQPTLSVFSWLIGEWQTNFKGYNRKAYDVPIEFVNTTMYSEVISFSVAPTLMFKTPSINFTSISTNYFDPDDVHVTHGFLTIDQYTSDPNSSISLMSVSNLGAIMIEEGKMTTPKNKYDGPRLDLALKYNHIPDELKEKVDKITRAFTTRNGQLIQYITRELRSKTTKHTKIYKKIQDVDFS